ncbi:MAG: NADP-dependent oxidoreductase [Rhodocyclaceae bacterium]|nr:NADP-dependent oxidoreductase [Rhodocyclaceae bacterium]
MKAIGLHQYRGPEVLHAIELPTPRPASGQVRIKVCAAGINPVDEMLRTGALATWYGDTPRPYVPGMDVAGIIDAIGPDMPPESGMAVGQPVVGIVDNFGSVGGYSEYVCLPAPSVMPIPAGVTFAPAASFLMNALTARNALDHLALPRGASILVTGAAGAVGAYTMALANAEGLKTVAVASAEDEDFLRQRGATHVVGRGERLSERIRERVHEGVDAIVDAAGIRRDVVGAVRDGGTIINLRPEPDETLERGIVTRFVNVRDHATDHAAIARLGQQVSEGLLPLRVAAIFPASEAVAAHRRFDAGKLRGRIVLDFEQSGL